MKITFIGLSCFLIENEKGFRILVDPFNDSDEWRLGPFFPKTFNNKPFGTNVLLISEPDADHAHAPGGWLQNGPPTKVNENPFPNLNLKGTLIYEYHGDVNIAWHYTVDGIRLAHFADNAHILTESQLMEIGNPDIIFLCPPKTDREEALEVTRKNIKLLNPKLIVWAHHITPENLPSSQNAENLRPYFIKYFKEKALRHKYYRDKNSFIEFSYMLENAYKLNPEYNGIIVDDYKIELNKKDLLLQKAVLFRKMYSL